MGLAAKIAKPN